MIPRATIFMTLAIAAAAVAQTPPPPTTQPGAEAGAAVVDLWPAPRPFATTRPEWVEERTNKQGRRDRMLRDVRHASLTLFPVAATTRPAPAVVICPGGGYAGEAIDKEGYDTARRLNAMGVAAFVLKYRLPGGVGPASDDAIPLPLQDARRAIRVVRARAAEWGVDPKRVGILGYSAGGHLAGSVTVNVAGDEPDDANDAASALSARPDFAALIYPVISMRDPLAHKGSRTNLLGKDASPSLVDRYSLETRVTTQAPPILLAHADDDKTVPVGNATAFVAAAQGAGVPVHFEHYAMGGHGFGTGVKGGESAAWPARLEAWLAEQHMR